MLFRWGIVIPALFGCLLSAQSKSLPPTEQPAFGTIYGLVVDQLGQPARGITLEASPLGVPLATALPRTKTDQQGKFRFAKIPWWGRYTIYANDAEAGFGVFASRPRNATTIQEITLSPEHPEAEFNFQLPLPAGFLQFHLTNSRTGEEIKGIEVDVSSAQEPNRFLFGIGCESDRPILIPPNEDVLLHVKSSGFKEWSESVGRGKPFRISSGAHVTLDVSLEPDK
jgi:hypothetical protein